MNCVKYFKWEIILLVWWTWSATALSEIILYSFSDHRLTALIIITAFPAFTLVTFLFRKYAWVATIFGTVVGLWREIHYEVGLIVGAVILLGIAIIELVKYLRRRFVWREVYE